jgi:voltage-gated potassium channel
MSALKEKIYEIIFKVDTPAGKAFDIVLIFTVILSVIFVMLESVETLNTQYPGVFKVAEWVFTILFSIELMLRLYSVEKKTKYLFSFYGIVDVLSIIPLYLTWMFPAASSFGIIRTFRILRIFRILKLNRYMNASNSLSDALYASRHKIIVFLGVTLTIVSTIGAIMYLIEGKAHGFTSIPKSIYWAIVTLTTVGYGDIVPQTVVGKALSSMLMIIGYGIIAVPTGLVSAEIVTKKLQENKKDHQCPQCHKSIHEQDANFCANCGQNLH